MQTPKLNQSVQEMKLIQRHLNNTGVLLRTFHHSFPHQLQNAPRIFKTKIRKQTKLLNDEQSNYLTDCLTKRHKYLVYCRPVELPTVCLPEAEIIAIV